ncbi:hypothetical protein GCM10022627_15250 [Haloarcula argentinensis]
MVVLCPNHHAHAGPNSEALTPDQLYESKKNPANGDVVDSPFHFESEIPLLQVSSNKCWLRENESIDVLNVKDETLVEMSFIDGLLQFDTKLYSQQGELVAEVDHNEWSAKTDGVWDIQYQPNRIKIWHEPRDIGLEIEYDSETDLIQMRGNFYYEDVFVRMTPEKINVKSDEGVQQLMVKNSTVIDRESFLEVSKENDNYRVALG